MCFIIPKMGYVSVWGLLFQVNFMKNPCKLRRIELFVRAFNAGRGGTTHVASECLRSVWAYKLFGNGDITVDCLRSGDGKL